MKFVIGITVAILSLCAVSCRNSSAIFSGDEVLARVGKKQLSTSDINAVLPKGLTGADSADYVDAYVEKWIIKQLKLQEAELMFSSSAADIDRMVDDYRQSLLIRKIEQYYLDTEMHNDVTDEEIEAYYDSHRGDFRLTKSIVKGRIVAVGENYRRREHLLRLMASPKKDESRDFEELCRKNNMRLTTFGEWVDFTEFLSNLPVLRSMSYDSYLSKRGVQQIHHDRTYYCFQITDALVEGDMMPLFMAKENIRRILINQRQGEVLHAREENIMRSALENGNARIFCEEKSGQQPET